MLSIFSALKYVRRTERREGLRQFAVCGWGNQNFVEIAVVNLNADISKRAGRDDAFSF